MMILQPRSGSKRPSGRWWTAGAACALLSAAAMLRAAAADWSQWGLNAQHTGATTVVAQPLQAILADVVYDALVEEVKDAANGNLIAHYAVPLLSGDSVYMEFISGEFGNIVAWDQWVWTVKRLRWQGTSLVEAWAFETDWKPVSAYRANWVPPLQSALSGDFVYVPGGGGTLHKLSKSTGAEVARINPFDEVDPSRRVAGGLAVAADGSIYYNVIALSLEDLSLTGSWLVRALPDGTTARADFATLTPGAPAATDPCEGSFSQSLAPLPPSPTSVPPTFPCGAQRAGINVVPAIGPDGTVYTVSVADNIDRYGYLIAVRPDLTPRWTASFRDILRDGCGVLLPRDNVSCRDNANLGVDPRTNNRPAGRVSNQGTSSPVVLPDGAVLIGTETFYNYSRGHLFKFDANGGVLATFDFGWDITPAVFPHDGTYSILIKNNHYSGPAGSTGRYEITSLDPRLVPEWSFPSTTTENCARQPDDSVVCTDDGLHAEGFEWCINQPAVDAAGVTYANSEDGSLYAIGPDGTLRQEIFLDTALGAAYTPVSIGPDGLVWTQNNGHLFAIGIGRAPRGEPQPSGAPRPAPRTRVR